jgi:RNA polymerase sigma-70 factor (ECF subfamily)
MNIQKASPCRGPERHHAEPPVRPGSLDFQAVHDQFRPRVLRQLKRLVGDGEAEDLTQSVMLKVSDGLPGFRGGSSLSTWIYRIATNAALDRMRRRNAMPAGEMSVDFEEEDIPAEARTASPEATAIHDETSACIRAFIERLPDNYRTVMMLSDVDGLKNEEIAAHLGLSVGTVKIRLHRAREKLRKELEMGCSFDHDEAGELGCDPKPGAAVIAVHR